MPAAASVTSTLCVAMPASSGAYGGERPWGNHAVSPRAHSTCDRLEEALCVLRVGHEQVLRLLVVVEHHLVVLAADTGLLVATERSVRRVGVVAVRPDPPGLDVAAGPVGGVGVTGPDTGAEAVQRVVGGLDGVVVVVELGHRDHRAEDLLLEDPHLVVALEDRRLDVEAARQLAIELGLLATGEDLRALLLGDVDVGQDLLVLVIGSL